jgi:glycosyltransferase involved in cell wall biosynthesis
LFCGRLSPEKGVETLLQAHAEDSNAWRLVVAGTGPSAPYLQSRYPLAEFTGHLGGAALEKLISEASVVVAPSECEENCPLSVLEAMAYAKPVIASRVGGVPELVRHGETGLLFHPSDRRDLSTQIKIMMNDLELRRKFGGLGRKIAESEYSLDSHGRSLLSLYRTVNAVASSKDKHQSSAWPTRLSQLMRSEREGAVGTDG